MTDDHYEKIGLTCTERCPSVQVPGGVRNRREGKGEESGGREQLGKGRRGRRTVGKWEKGSVYISQELH